MQGLDLKANRDGGIRTRDPLNPISVVGPLVSTSEQASNNLGPFQVVVHPHLAQDGRKGADPQALVILQREIVAEVGIRNQGIRFQNPTLT